MGEGFPITGPRAGGAEAIASSPWAVKADREKGTKGVQGAASGADRVELSAEAQRRVTELKQVDQRVRTHEAAHMAAGGGLVQGGASYSYTRGPDGKAYAVAGEVSIDASAVPDDPAATLRKAQRIVAAALAPADPSPQDRKVAAAAGAMAAEAASELARKGVGSLVDTVA